MPTILLVSLLLPLTYLSQAQPMKSFNAGNAPFRGSLFLPSQRSSNSNLSQNSNGFQQSQNFQSNNTQIFASNPNVLPMQYHRLNPTLPLINLNKSGSGPVIIGMDKNSKQNQQNQMYSVTQGVQYINGFRGGNFPQNFQNSTQFFGNQNVTFSYFNC